MYTKAKNALFDCMSSVGTHETTAAKAFDLPLAEVEATANRLVADGTLIRMPTGVLFFSAAHFARIAGPSARGGSSRRARRS